MTSFILIINCSKPFFSVAFSLPAAFDIFVKSSWHFLGFDNITLWIFLLLLWLFQRRVFCQSLNWPSSRLGSGFLPLLSSLCISPFCITCGLITPRILSLTNNTRFLSPGHPVLARHFCFMSKDTPHSQTYFSPSASQNKTTQALLQRVLCFWMVLPFLILHSWEDSHPRHFSFSLYIQVITKFFASSLFSKYDFQPRCCHPRQVQHVPLQHSFMASSYSLCRILIVPRVILLKQNWACYSLA